MKTKEQIIQWYKDNGYYEELVKEVEKQHGKSFEDFISDRDGNKLSPFVLITWSVSELGDDYWIEAGDRFVDWYNKETDEQSTQPAPSKEIDWEQRRYEIAKEIYSRLIFAPKEEHSLTAEADAESAVELADILINELKKNKEG